MKETPASSEKESVESRYEQDAFHYRYPRASGTRIVFIDLHCTNSGHAVAYDDADKMALWKGVTQLRGVNIFQRRVCPALDGTEFIGPGYVRHPLYRGWFQKACRFRSEPRCHIASRAFPVI